MSASERQQLGSLALLVLVVALLLIVSGALWHGITTATWHRFWHDIAARPDARMRFRFILQPAMACLVAIRDGRSDARRGRPPYFWAILWHSGERVGRLNEGLNATARIILLGLIMDVIYQALVLRTFYPNEALLIALLLAFVPYIILRGLITRVARRRQAGASPSGSA